MTHLQVDYALSLPSVVGARAGIDPARLLEDKGRWNALHDQLEAAVAGGLVPHFRDPPDEAARRAAAELADCRQLLIVGEPGAVGATTVVVPDPRVATLSYPDPDKIRRYAATEGLGLIVIDGPGWVRELAQGLAEYAGAVVTFADESIEDAWQLGLRIAAPQAGDPRWACLGVVARTLWHWRGADLPALDRAIRDTHGRLQHAGLYDNVAYRLAATLHRAARQGRTERVVLYSADSLSGWAAWSRRCWGAMLAKGGQALGGPPASARIGDEAWTQVLVGGPGAPLVLVLSVDSMEGDERLGVQDSALLLERRIERRHLEGLASEMVPVVRLRMSDASAPSRAVACLVWLQACTMLALAVDVDPLSMPVADRIWRGS